MRIIKGKDNFKPTKQVYKVNYIYRDVFYIKNHLDEWQSEINSGLKGMKMVIANHQNLYDSQRKALREKISNDEGYAKIDDKKLKMIIRINTFWMKEERLLNYNICKEIRL
ncbi:hypothetical protein [uncultured Algibacter sp.]|uniref:hypothetical protein n=1 Tax=uncultured Algibacter sp. TaxID=298659 RepID=UPI002620CD69|nr:hypothetical protein [uncultured Algibacter sp.]